MPVFYLHICNGEVITDTDGTEFADAYAAYQAAIRTAREILSDEVKEGAFNVHHRLEITDADGETLMIVPFSEAVDLSNVPSGSRPNQR